MIELVDAIAKCSTSEEIGRLASAVARLTAETGAKVGLWPPYDQRRAREKLDELATTVEHKRREIEPLRFRFIGDPEPPLTKPRTMVNVEMTPLAGVGHVITDITNNDQGRTVLAPQEHVWIRQVTGSRVDVSAALLHVNDAESAIFRLSVAGPSALHHLTKCVVIINHSHQLRLHHLNQVVVVVADGKLRTLTMEKCREVYVATSDSRNVSVDDFDWPRRDAPDPHWHHVSDAKLVTINTVLENTELAVTDCIESVLGLVTGHSDLSP